MPTTIQYLIVPAWSDQGGQCRIVRREHEINHPDPLQHYRQYPEQWKEAGLMNSRGVVVTLDASPEVLQEFRDCEPLMAGTCFAFPAPVPAPVLVIGDGSSSPRPDLAPLVPLVAADFALALEAEIGEDGLAEVVAQNLAEPNAEVCRSHDFCDPNILMAEAIKARTGLDPGEEGVLMDEQVTALWASAWGMARDRFFADTEAAREVVGSGPGTDHLDSSAP